MSALDRPVLFFDTWQYVYERASAKPYVGFEHLADLPEGFKFDIKRWCSPFDLKLPTMPRLANPSTQGVDESLYFKSGVANEKVDLIVDYLDEHFIDNERLWLPHLRHGFYYRYKTDYFYYSDNSVIQYVDPIDNVDGRNCLTLTRQHMPGKPILAASFKRDLPSRAIVYDTRVMQVPVFSGEYIDSEEQKTYTPATQSIVWDSVDTTKREFVLDQRVKDVTTLKFNRDYIEHVGVTPQYPADFGACDMLGQSDNTEFQSFYLRKFPVVPETFKLYIVNPDTSSAYESLGYGEGYYGEGGYGGGDRGERSVAWEEWTRLETYQELLYYMTSGIVSPYEYGGKFYYLDRDLGRVIFGNMATGVPTQNFWVVAQYDVTLRVEYEEINFSTDIIAKEANINPVGQSVNQGFVLITHEPLEVAKIDLVINKDKIEESIDAYGPVYIGNDWAQLMATAVTVDGISIPNTKISFSMTPFLGYIGGGGSNESVGVTDSLGQAYTYYQPPIDAESIGYYATDPEAIGSGGWLQLDKRSTGLTIDDDIYLYQVLKDDPLLGMHEDYIERYLPEPPAWADPDLTPSLYEQWKENTLVEMGFERWSTNTGTGKPNGRKVVVYQWDSDAVNPVIGELGAFVPVHPLEISEDGSRLRFPSEALLPFDPVDPIGTEPYNHDIGAYWVVGSFYVSFWATCWSPYYNKVIRSNEIRVKITLPRYLLGEHINEELRRLPLGWKIYEDAEHNHAAGLDGATFLTINPTSGPYPIINWFGSEPTGEWAQEIMSTVSFKITNTG